MKDIPEGQKHILRYWNELSPVEREELEKQIDSIDFDLLRELTAQAACDRLAVRTGLGPAPVVRLPRSQQDLERRSAMSELGERALREGRIAVVTAAGGQATRLGIEGPKGTVSIGLPSGRSLFQILADALNAMSARVRATVPWYLMVSEDNEQETKEFFREHSFFGMGKENVFFMPQATIPAVDTGGKLILCGKGRIFMNPSGHGGTFGALASSGAFDDMDRRGTDLIFYCQVDNALTKMCDPVFMGYHMEACAEMSLKVMAKRYAEEKLGILGMLDGKFTVIEYSDLTREDMYATAAAGGLLYWAGSIATHVLNKDFARRVAAGHSSLPYHCARKPLPCYDAASGRTVMAEGVKFETFVFDAVPLTSRVLAMEVARQEEFAPVKSRTGEDSMESALAAVTEYYARWLEEAGVEVPRQDDGRVRFPIEISPHYAMNAEELKRKLPAGFAVRGPTHLA